MVIGSIRGEGLPRSPGDEITFFPSCDAVAGEPYVDTFNYVDVPPVAAGETILVDIVMGADVRDFGGGVACAAVVYSDAAAGHWITDWGWGKFEAGSPPVGVSTYRVRESDRERVPGAKGLYYEPDEQG